VDRNRKQTVSDSNSKDLRFSFFIFLIHIPMYLRLKYMIYRLNRALADLDKYKSLLAKASSESKDQLDLTKKNSEKLFVENNRLTKQKQDLLTALKKQAQLIEILKKQKVRVSLKLIV
jgi:hypothetical protein